MTLPRVNSTAFALVAIGALLVATSLFSGPAGSDPPPASAPGPSTADTPEKSAIGSLHPVVINRPSGPPRVATGQFDSRGRPVLVACTTCHATRAANVDNRFSADLDEFHQGLVIEHAQLSCLSCHNPTNYDTLRRADGTAIEFVDTMQLCAQCHGPQHRDYQHGSHGGMTGYWDLTRGPRQRNHCIDCHDPHAPAYGKVTPVFPPRDRFLRPDRKHGGDHE